MSPGGSEPFRFGINYWPARSAMRWWREFDRGEVEADFGTIRSAGFDSVRVFLLWEDFQPRPDAVSPDMLDRLATVADVADARGLGLLPALFTGHMSGANWIPAWALEDRERAGRFPTISGGRRVPRLTRGWFEDETIASAQELMAERAAHALRGHPALWAWDLGNENSNVSIPGTRESGQAWLRRMSVALRRADPGTQVTIGLHMEDLEEDRRIGPAEAAEVSDFLSMHGYPLYAKWARGATDPLLPAFLGEVTRCLGGRDVLFQEFGMPSEDAAAERAAASFLPAALAALRGAGMTGAMLWCFADYRAAIWSEPPFDAAPHERFFGLWRADGSPKPALAALAAVPLAPRAPPPDPGAWFDLRPEVFYESPLENLRRLYERYRAARPS